MGVARFRTAHERRRGGARAGRARCERGVRSTCHERQHDTNPDGLAAARLARAACPRLRCPAAARERLARGRRLLQAAHIVARDVEAHRRREGHCPGRGAPLGCAFTAPSPSGSSTEDSASLIQQAAGRGKGTCRFKSCKSPLRICREFVPRTRSFFFVLRIAVKQPTRPVL